MYMPVSDVVCIPCLYPTQLAIRLVISHLLATLTCVCCVQLTAMHQDLLATVVSVSLATGGEMSWTSRLTVMVCELCLVL